MSDLVRNIIRFILFVFVQVYVLDVMPHLHQLITPYIYFLFILWLPFYMSRMALLFVGFLLGLTVDYFSMTPGLHAAACTLIAYCRPFIINVFASKDTAEFNYKEPSPKALGFKAYALYVIILTLLHNGYLLFLEWLSFGSLIHFLMKLFTTTAISLLMIFIVELIFPRRLKYRTNVA
ncbi:MAG: rod shape-determining protein MreD [Niabella sp.]